MTIRRERLLEFDCNIKKTHFVMYKYTSYCHDTNQKTINVLILTYISKMSESKAVTAEGRIKTKEGMKK